METCINFGKTLKFIRKSFDYTQEAVSHYLNIERQTYSHYETGRNLPSVEVLYRLANFYHIGVENFYLPLYDPRNDIIYQSENTSVFGKTKQFPDFGNYNFSNNGENHVLVAVTPDVAQITTFLSDFSKSDLDETKAFIKQLHKLPPK